MAFGVAFAFVDRVHVIPKSQHVRRTTVADAIRRADADFRRPARQRSASARGLVVVDSEEQVIAIAAPADRTVAAPADRRMAAPYLETAVQSRFQSDAQATRVVLKRR
jgi:hypothetical protein